MEGSEVSGDVRWRLIGTEKHKSPSPHVKARANGGQIVDIDMEGVR
jgi:hypothetical protein